MASNRKEIVIDASAERVWDALRDWGALHVRLMPALSVIKHTLESDQPGR
jgi:hypothetical protein